MYLVNSYSWLNWRSLNEVVFTCFKLFSKVVVVRLINLPGFCKISGEWGLTSLFTKPIHHKALFI